MRRITEHRDQQDAGGGRPWGTEQANFRTRRLGGTVTERAFTPTSSIRNRGAVRDSRRTASQAPEKRGARAGKTRNQSNREKEPLELPTLLKGAIGRLREMSA